MHFNVHLFSLFWTQEYVQNWKKNNIQERPVIQKADSGRQMEGYARFKKVPRSLPGKEIAQRAQ